MKELERLDLIDSIAACLQSRMTTQDINVFLSGFEVKCKDVKIVESKRQYVKQLLASPVRRSNALSKTSSRNDLVRHLVL